MQPPAYLVLMHWWISLWGAQVAVLRLPSEIAGILAVGALYLLAKRLYGTDVALAAALLGALSPFWIWHAQEVRMYSFLLLFTILSSHGLVLALRAGRRLGWALFVLASVAALYTHYFAVLVLVAQAIFVAATWKELDRPTRISCVAAALVIGAAYSPWAWMTAHTSHGATEPDLVAPNLYTPLVLLTQFLLGYLTVPLTSQVVAAWPLLILLRLGLGRFGGNPSWRGLYMWLLLLTPVVLTFGVSLLVRPVLATRYLIVCTPALYLLSALALHHLLSSRFRVAAMVALVPALLGTGDIEASSASNPQVEDYRSVMSYVAAHAQPDDAVAVDSFFNQIPYSYYERGNLPAYDLPYPPAAPGITRPRQIDSRYLSSYLAGIEAGRKRLWVIYYLEGNGGHESPERRFLDYHTAGHRVIFGGRYGRSDPNDPRSYVNVQLVVYQLIPQTPQTAQTRPPTVQDLQLISAVSPTLTHPLAPSFDPAPRESASVVGGPVLTPPDPHPGLLIPGGDAGSAPRVSIFNPNVEPTHVDIQSGDPVVATHVVVQPLSELDAQVPGDSGPMVLTSQLPVVARRVIMSQATPQAIYGRPFANAFPASPPPGMPVAVPRGMELLVRASPLNTFAGTYLVRTASGREVVQTGVWSYNPRSAGTQVVAAIPTSRLRPQLYEVDLYTNFVDARGQPFLLRRVSFSVST